LSDVPGAEPLLRLRPLGLGEVLDDIFRVYRRHFWLLCGMALLLSLPSLLLGLASGSADTLGYAVGVIGDFANPRALASRPPPPTPDFILLVVSYLVALLMVPLTAAVVSRAAIDLVLGVPVSIRSALAGAGRRALPLLGLSLLYLLILPLSLCLPVFLWFWVRWIVAIPVLLAEDVGPVRALDRSWTLTTGSWWRVFGILVVVYLLQNTLAGALGILAFPLGIAIPFIPAFVRGAIILTISACAAALVLPVLYLCLVLLYFDLRIRREGFDLDQLASRAVGSAP
jgi:hypothetical protein